MHKSRSRHLLRIGNATALVLADADVKDAVSREILEGLDAAGPLMPPVEDPDPGSDS